MFQCSCKGELKYKFTAQNKDHTILVYECKKCKKIYEDKRYRYTEGTCPKHHWIFETWGFQDDQYKHSIYHLYICDRCGKQYKEHLDSAHVGIREAVDMEDPRVKKATRITPETARFHFDKDDLANFWSE